MSDDEPLFDVDGHCFIPSEYTRGPWDPGLLHGGPVAALFAELLQDEGGGEFQPARMTVDLMRPVPMKPLACDRRVVRQGRRLQLLEGELADGRTAVARCTLLLIRPLELEGDEVDAQALPPTDAPEDAVNRWGLEPDAPSFIGGGMDFRFIGSGEDLRGGVAWFRVRRPVLPDRAASGLARAVAASDVGGAVSSRGGPRASKVSFINADITTNLSRVPEGEWIRLTSTAAWTAAGVGQVNSSLGDTRGPCGTANQVLVLERRSEG